MPHHDFEDVSLHYTIHGDGPPLFLAFCLGGNLGMWGDEVARLAQHHRVILWDPRGHGGTSSPAAPEAYGVKRSADDLLALMDHLHIDKAIVGGVSMGGGIAAVFAGRYPRRTSAALIMDSNTAAGLPVPEKVKQTRLDTIALCEAGDMEAVAEFFLAASPVYKLYGGDSDDARARVRRMIVQMNPVGFANTLRSMLELETRTEDLKLITAPALVLCGENDPARKAVEMTAGELEGSRLVYLQDAGHLSNVDQPAEFADAVLSFTSTL